MYLASERSKRDRERERRKGIWKWSLRMLGSRARFPAGAFAIFPLLPKLHFQFIFPLSLPLPSFRFPLPSTFRLRLTTPSSHFSLWCILVKPVTCTQLSHVSLPFVRNVDLRFDLSVAADHGIVTNVYHCLFFETCQENRSQAQCCSEVWKKEAPPPDWKEPHEQGQETKIKPDLVYSVV